MKNINQRIFCVSDLHAPFMHLDSVAFLTAIKRKYKPTRVVLLGDEVDSHNLSFHDSDSDLPSAGDELKLAIEQLKPIYKLFPVADIIDSNHGSMHFRKAKHHGIPTKYLRDYGEILEAPKTWKWSHDLTLTVPGGNQVYFHHGLSSNIMKVVAQRATCTVQGHFHSQFSIGYLGNPNSLLWGMQLGCSIDDKSLAFAYNKTTLSRPILGHGIIIDGHPKLLPMVLNKNGRWNKFVP